jgi:hypothetical protein
MTVRATGTRLRYPDLAAFAGSQAWNARQPAQPGLPNCAEDAGRLLAAVRVLARPGR